MNGCVQASIISSLHDIFYIVAKTGLYNFFDFEPIYMRYKGRKQVMGLW